MSYQFDFNLFLKSEYRDVLEYFLSILDGETAFKLSLTSKTFYKRVHTVRNSLLIERIKDYKFEVENIKDMKDASPYIDLVKDWDKCPTVPNFWGYINSLSNNNPPINIETITMIAKEEKDVDLKTGDNRIKRNADITTIKPLKNKLRLVSNGLILSENITEDFLYPLPIISLPFCDLSLDIVEGDGKIKVYDVFLGIILRQKIAEMKKQLLPLF